MSFSGGVFSINTSGQPVVTGTTISSTVFNALTADLAGGLSTCLLKDGTQIVTASIPMAGFRFTGLGAGAADAESVRRSQVGMVAVYATTVAASVSAFTIGSVFTSAYQQYMVRISNLRPDTNATQLYVRVSTDGSTFKANGDYSTNLYGLAAGAAATSSGYIGILAGTVSASAILLSNSMWVGGAVLNSELMIDNPVDTVNSKVIKISTSALNSNSNEADMRVGAGSYIGSVSAISALQFFVSAGNVASCKVAVYGINFVSGP